MSQDLTRTLIPATVTSQENNSDASSTSLYHRSSLSSRNTEIDIYRSNNIEEIDAIEDYLPSVSIQKLLNFDDSISDELLLKKLRYFSYVSRLSSLCNNILFFEKYPSAILICIISYELSDSSLDKFVINSLKNTYIKKNNYILPYISGWILTLVGVYLLIASFIYHIFNIHFYRFTYSIELSVVLLLCFIHFVCISSVYLIGRKNNSKISKISSLLKFNKNYGEVYIPTLRWLGFPFVESFKLDWKWYFLLGFKYWIMVILFIILCLPYIWLISYPLYIIVPPVIIICWIGAWLHLLTFTSNTSNNRYKTYVDFCKITIMIAIICAIFYGLINIQLINIDISTYTDYDNYKLDFHTDAFKFTISLIFFIVFLCIEIRIIYSWKSVTTRYNYFGWQLLASLVLVMLFVILKFGLLLLISFIIVLYNAALIWNDLMHKKIMQTTYDMNKKQYVNRFRPIYNTDIDSEWLTSIFWFICPLNCVKKCRGRWVIGHYVGLLTGRITKPTNSYL